MELLDLSYIQIALLLLLTMAGACFTTAVGMGGGIIVIGAMSLFLPINILIPVHGIVQGISGLYRSFTFRKTFLKKFFVIFALGSLFGYGIGINFLVTLPNSLLKLFLGIGIIALTSIPKFKIKNMSNFAIFTCGATTGFLTMFMGVMGPILGTFLASFLKDRYFIVGTLSWCMAFQNLGKATIFSAIGFDYKPWIMLIAMLTVVSYMGVFIGKKLLDKNSNELFKKILKFVCLLLGGKLILEGLYKHFYQ